MMEKLCILKTACKNPNNYKILNSCRGKYQIVRDLTEADWIVFPFCSCTDINIIQFEQKLVYILNYKKETCKLIVTGCITYVKKSKKDFLKKYNIDYVVPAQNEVEGICEILGVEPVYSSYNSYDVIGNVDIAEGCLNKCSFCRIHYSNRPLLSVPMEKIEEEVQDLISNGIKYINLTALNSAQYGIDLYERKMLHILIQRLSKIDGIKGISISGLSLSDIYDELVDELSKNELIIDISIDIQSGSDRLLKLMNVGHSVKDVKKYFSLLNRKIKYTRIISGFPTETEEDVIQTIQLLQMLQIPNIDISEYCDSKDTPSGKMPQLSQETAQKHSTMYNTALTAMLKDMDIKNNGQTYIGYISKFSLDYLHVYCPNYKSVYLRMKKDYFNFNLNDKVKVKLLNGEYSIVELIESSNIVTIPPKPSNNKLVDILTNLKLITTELGRDITDLNNILLEVFTNKGGLRLSIEEFKNNIPNEPEVLRDALITLYNNVHKTK